jgi:hypothetical protein
LIHFGATLHPEHLTPKKQICTHAVADRIQDDWLLPTPVQQDAIPLILGGGVVLSTAIYDWRHTLRELRSGLVHHGMSYIRATVVGAYVGWGHVRLPVLGHGWWGGGKSHCWHWGIVCAQVWM